MVTVKNFIETKRFVKKKCLIQWPSLKKQHSGGLKRVKTGGRGSEQPLPKNRITYSRAIAVTGQLSTAC